MGGVAEGRKCLIKNGAKAKIPRTHSLVREESESLCAIDFGCQACRWKTLFMIFQCPSILSSLWAHAHGLVALYRVGRFGSDPALFRGIFRRSLHRHLEALSR